MWLIVKVKSIVTNWLYHRKIRTCFKNTRNLQRFSYRVGNGLITYKKSTRLNYTCHLKIIFAIVKRKIRHFFFKIIKLIFYTNKYYFIILCIAFVLCKCLCLHLRRDLSRSVVCFQTIFYYYIKHFTCLW